MLFSLIIKFNLFQVSLLTSDGNTKDDLRLPTDETLVAQVCMEMLSILSAVSFLVGFRVFSMMVLFVSLVICAFSVCSLP